MSWLAYLGLPAREIQEIAGHAHLAAPQRYMHVAPDALERVREVLENATSADKWAQKWAQGRRASGLRVVGGRSPIG